MMISLFKDFIKKYIFFAGNSFMSFSNYRFFLNIIFLLSFLFFYTASYTSASDLEDDFLEIKENRSVRIDCKSGQYFYDEKEFGLTLLMGCVDFLENITISDKRSSLLEVLRGCKKISCIKIERFIIKDNSIEYFRNIFSQSKNLKTLKMENCNFNYKLNFKSEEHFTSISDFLSLLSQLSNLDKLSFKGSTLFPEALKLKSFEGKGSRKRLQKYNEWRSEVIQNSSEYLSDFKCSILNLRKTEVGDCFLNSFKNTFPKIGKKQKIDFTHNNISLDCAADFICLLKSTNIEVDFRENHEFDKCKKYKPDDLRLRVYDNLVTNLKLEG